MIFHKQAENTSEVVITTKSPDQDKDDDVLKHKIKTKKQVPHWAKNWKKMQFNTKNNNCGEKIRMEYHLHYF